jgi:hypothetical protein
MRANFQWLGLGVIGAIVVVGAGWYRTLSRVRLFLAWLNERKARLGLWAVPLMLSLSILSWMVSLSVLSYHFTTRRPDEIRLLFESGKFLIPWFTWCVSAYGVGEIFYGEGTFRKILINSAWALWPVIVLLVPVNLLTNIISLNEKSLYSLLWYCVWGLLFWQFLMMIKETHQFELDQAFSIMVLTLVGMALIWILVGLVYALTAEIFRFIGQLVLEVYVRLY